MGDRVPLSAKLPPGGTGARRVRHGAWAVLPARAASYSALIAALAVGAASFLLLAQPFAMPASATRAAALAILAIGAWSTRILPEHITALGFFLVAIFLSGAPAETIFSGFASTAFWLTLGG